MRHKKFTKCMLFSILSLGLCTDAIAQITKFTLPTKWSEEALTSEIPLSEYPRPQMVRSKWMNLNGTWDYMGGKQMADPRNTSVPPTFSSHSEKIKVPFPPESDLSGIARKDETFLWYRRSITIPQEWKNKNILLH